MRAILKQCDTVTRLTVLKRLKFIEANIWRANARAAIRLLIVGYCRGTIKSFSLQSPPNGMAKNTRWKKKWREVIANRKAVGCHLPRSISSIIECCSRLAWVARNRGDRWCQRSPVVQSRPATSQIATAATTMVSSEPALLHICYLQARNEGWQMAYMTMATPSSLDSYLHSCDNDNQTLSTARRQCRPQGH